MEKALSHTINRHTIPATIANIIADCEELSTCLIVLSQFDNAVSEIAFVTDKLTQRLGHAIELVQNKTAPAPETSELENLIAANEMAQARHLEAFDKRTATEQACMDSKHPSKAVVAKFNTAEEAEHVALDSLVNSIVAVVGFPIQTMATLKTKAQWLKDNYHDNPRADFMEYEQEALLQSFFDIA